MDKLQLYEKGPVEKVLIKVSEWLVMLSIASAMLFLIYLFTVTIFLCCEGR